MGTDFTQIVEELPCPRSIKVHRLMCAELLKFVDRISKIFPEIEAARPRCVSGIQALSLLNRAIEKAKLLLQQCCESSMLYLAIIGEAILSRCEKSRNLLLKSLSQIQNMVPVMLAAEISRIIADLGAVTFTLDSSEEEAGKVLQAFLHQHESATDMIEKCATEALRFAALRLHITSQKDLLIEKRSIKKQLNKVGDSEQAKKEILLCLFNLLKKYGQLIVRQQTECPFVQQEESYFVSNSLAVEVDSHIDLLGGSIPPEEFKCPISLRVMYDPVVIASGQTFERMWIQRWFGEGNDTCPKTKRKLAHLSLTPNTSMKALISKWCTAHGITIPDPCIQDATFQTWETSSSSVASLSNSMNDLQLPIDFSNISLGSLDTSYSSDSSRVKITNSLNLMSMQTSETMKFLCELDALSWESQCKAVEDVKNHLKHDDQACHSLSSENFVEPLIRFLKDACDLHDVGAQRTGSQLLLAFVSKCRSSTAYLDEDAYNLLALFLDSDVTEEALAIMEKLSCHQDCRSKIVASGALTSILKMVDIQTRKFHEPVIKILYNLSSSSDICSLIVSLEFIPKLVCFFEDSNLARYCITILKNLCCNERARISVAETDGCIASIAKLLEMDSHEVQDQVVAILLSLCSQRIQYCRLIMDEGVIPDLVRISKTGSDKGQAIAVELLRILGDIEYSDLKECPGSHLAPSREDSGHCEEKKLSSKQSRIFGMKIPPFLKPSSLTPKKKK